MQGITGSSRLCDVAHLLCHELQIGIGDEDGTAAPFGDVMQPGGMPERTRHLVHALHDAVSRGRAATDADSTAVAAATSHRCYHALRAYANSLQSYLENAPADRIASVQDIYQCIDFAARVWALLHSTWIDPTRLPSLGYLDFYRMWKEDQLIGHLLGEVHSMCETAMASLPPVVAGMLLGVADALDPVTQLHITVQSCMMQPDDHVTQSQLASVAADWSDWLGRSTGVTEYIEGLVKLGRTSIASRMIELSNIFLTLTGRVSLESPTAALLHGIYDSLRRYDDVAVALAQAKPDCKAYFSQWRATVHQLYHDVMVLPDNAPSDYQTPAEVIQAEHEGRETETFMTSMLRVLELLAVSEELTGSGLSSWYEFLALVLCYLQPGMPRETLVGFMGGRESLFFQMGMDQSAVEDLPDEEKVLIKALRGQMLDVVSDLAALRIPCVVPHLTEVLCGIPSPSQQALQEMRSQVLASYAGELMAHPAEWRKALDYCVWAGGDEGKAAFLNILPTLEMNATGIDYLLALYDLWRPHDGDKVIFKHIRAFLVQHGHSLCWRGLTVEGIRRLLQAEDYDGVSDHILRLLNDWVTNIIETIDLTGVGGGANRTEIIHAVSASPLLSVAEAIRTQVFFAWPEAPSAIKKTVPSSWYFGAPPPSTWDLLALSPRFTELASAIREDDMQGQRDATLSLLRDPATPPRARLALILLTIPLLEDS
eukprot:Sspe_Gene.98799::Locus_72194_Transcript_1_1_Confidence_1.000_Length_2186::g.98799::m.98799